VSFVRSFEKVGLTACTVQGPSYPRKRVSRGEVAVNKAWIRLHGNDDLKLSCYQSI
jgi:hypothetical protein